MEIQNTAAEAFGSEAGTVPSVVNSGADAPTATPSADFTNYVEEAKVTTGNQKFYTEDDLARVRSQEKDKLYPQIESLKEELSFLKKEREEKLARQQAEEQAERARLEAEERARREAEMDSKEFAKSGIEELKEQLERERQERERAFALLEREKAYAELQAYRQQVIEVNKDDIMPELLDLVTGDTIEEINLSIAGLKERSSRILESAQQAMQSARRDMTGTRVTSPQAGPLDINTGNRQFSAEDISTMSMNDYAKYRQQLLSDKARGTAKGMLG